MTLTATKCQTGDTNARYAPPDDIHSSGIKRSIHLIPGKTRTELDRSGSSINRYIVEACQGNMNTPCRGEPRITRVTPTLHRKRRAGRPYDA